MDHRLPTTNSPNINPRKNGMLCRCSFKPPILRIINLIIQLINMELQNTFMDQLLDTANPAGWNAHQINRIRIMARAMVESNPTPMAAVAA